MLSRSELEQLSETDVRVAIPEEKLNKALATAPFVATAPRTMTNVRDLGNVPNSAIKPGLIFRCAMLDPRDAATTSWLAENVKTIVDIRGLKESQRAPDPRVDGITNIHVAPQSPWDGPDLGDFAQGDGTSAWKWEYLALMRCFQGTFKEALGCIRDRPGEPLLFHCTAGRDRTGIFAGILHSLAGTPPDDIVYDYLLSRVGIETQRVALFQVMKRHAGLKDVDDATLEDTPGLMTMATLSAPAWNAFAAGVQSVYGGFEGFVKFLGFSEEDIAIIKKNLRGEAPRT